MKKTIVHLIVPMLFGAFAFGIGLRFWVQYFINNTSIYQMNMFDMLFDWGILMIGGICCSVISVRSIIKMVYK